MNTKKAEEKTLEKEDKKKKTEERTIEELTEENKELKEENELLKKDKLLLLANNENARKRYLADAQEFQKYASERLWKKILPFVNNYERALMIGQQFKDTKVNNFLNGFKIMHDDLKKILKLEGIEEISITVEKDLLDNNFHEVLEELETDGYQPETILEVMQKGYLLNSRVLVPAKVKISKPLEKKQNNNKNK